MAPPTWNQLLPVSLQQLSGQQATTRKVPIQDRNTDLAWGWEERGQSVSVCTGTRKDLLCGSCQMLLWQGWLLQEPPGQPVGGTWQHAVSQHRILNLHMKKADIGDPPGWHQGEVPMCCAQAQLSPRCGQAMILMRLLIGSFSLNLTSLAVLFGWSTYDSLNKCLSAFASTIFPLLPHLPPPLFFYF